MNFTNFIGRLRFYFVSAIPFALTSCAVLFLPVLITGCSALLNTASTLGLSKAASLQASLNNNQSGTVGTPLSSAFVTTVTNSQEAPVEGATVTWAVTEGSGSLSDAITFTDENGHASSTLTLGSTAGTTTVTATVVGTNISAVFTALSQPGPATKLVFHSQPGGGAAGSAWIQQPVIYIEDTFGNVVSSGSDSTNTITLAPSASSITSGSTSVAASGGIATFSGLEMTLSGSYTLTATGSGDLSSTTKLSSSFLITGGSPSSIAISANNNQSAAAGSLLSSALTAVVKDSYSNLVQGATVTWAVGSGGGSVSGCSSSSTNASGLATCTPTLGNTAGANTFTASVAGVASPASFSATGTAPVAPGIAFNTPASSPGTNATPSFNVTLQGGVSFLSSYSIAIYNQGSCAGSSVGSTSGVSSTSATITVSTQAQGNTTYSALVSDTHGNSTCSSSNSTAGLKSVAYVYDNTAPTWSNTLSNASTFDNTSESPVVTFTANASDGGSGSGIQEYEYSVGTTSGATNLVGWTILSGGAAPTTTVQVTGLSLSLNTTYYFNMRVLDNVNLASTVYTSSWATTAWTGVKQMGAAGQYTAGSSATDSNGNVFVGGWTSGGLNGNSVTGLRDLFIAKYNSSGSFQWLKQLGVSGKYTNGGGVATDSSGNVFIAGWTTGALPGNSQSGSYDSFIAKYNSLGTLQWVHQMGVSGQSTYGGSVAIDSSGNVFVGGYTSGGLDGHSQTGNNDFFIAKYSNLGSLQWLDQMGSSAGNDSELNGLTIDSGGNIFVTGYTTASLDGNPQMGSYDFFVGKFNPSGGLLWLNQMGATSGKFSYGDGVTTDASGNVYVGGQTSGGLDGYTQTGAYDSFIAKYNSTGSLQWFQQMGASAGQFTGASYLTMDSSGNLYVGGYTTGGLNGASQTGSYDMYIARYSSLGTLQWLKQLGASGKNTYVGSLSIDSSGNIFVGGETSGGLDGNTVAGLDDYFLAKYNPSGTLQ